MNSLVDILILLHASLGTIALLSGGISLIFEKGKKLHKKAGRIFYYSMILSSLLAIVISNLPQHQNAFLFFIGIFSLYFVLSGFRSIQYKLKNHNFTIDQILAVLMVVNGLTLLLLPIFQSLKFNLLFTIFGATSLLFGLNDIKNFYRKEHLKKNWLSLHLGKMTGGYISAVSAFFVVNNILPGIWNWITPGLFGGVFIAFSIQKVKKS